ncbi:UDP-N-acetylglucosamine 1-carboxyvinyltransferase [Patescibacteria group bacterium]|nr:UDP-N-acetylglucosamine 1-carboxyvinyltransferase [Patescibacteria group bacterium]
MKTTPKNNSQGRSYIVRGGNPLNGEISVSGAKNAATKQMVACLLTSDPVTLKNIPQIGDVEATAELLEGLGVKIEKNDQDYTISAASLNTSKVSAAFSRKNRIPILLIGPLLHRFGEARIPMLGGCKIGPRPIDIHMQGLEKMGAEVTCEDGYYTIRAKELKATMIELRFPSVGATENLMLAAVLAKGTTTIANAAIEPEIMDTAKLLQAMGAIINLEANRTWVIEGVEKLNGAVHEVIPDRIEAASFGIAAALTGGSVFIRNARQNDLLSFLNAIRKVGVPFTIQSDGILFGSAESYKPVVIETDVHPGFMTDWQQPFVMLLTQANGVSIVHETIFEDRFGYTESLKQMGAHIQLHSDCLGSKECRYKHQNYMHSCIVSGPTPLKAADICIPDLRAGFSYLLAALMADGESHITGIDHIERGYEKILDKMKSLGADIEVTE